VALLFFLLAVLTLVLPFAGLDGGIEGGGGTVQAASLNVCSHSSLLNFVSLAALGGSEKARPCGPVDSGGGGGMEVSDGDWAACPGRTAVAHGLGCCPPRRDGEPRLDVACGGAK
jgi:hypothetical protein